MRMFRIRSISFSTYKCIEKLEKKIKIRNDGKIAIVLLLRKLQSLILYYDPLIIIIYHIIFLFIIKNVELLII